MTFKLEVGKEYLTRGGNKVLIESQDDQVNGFPYWGDNGTSYSVEGDSGWPRSYDLDLVFPVVQEEIKHSHYKKDVLHLNTVDIYRVLELFEVRSHAVGHAIKKLLMAGNRGAKGYEQDIQEAIDSLNRELQMKQEDSNG